VNVASQHDAWGEGMSENGKAPTSAAERMRRYRKRHRRGQRIIRVQIDADEPAPLGGGRRIAAAWPNSPMWF
jgi:hypothetical protein